MNENREMPDDMQIEKLDIQEQKVYAYPYNEFKSALSEMSRESLKTQYEEAIANDNFVIFIQDNEKKNFDHTHSLKNKNVIENLRIINKEGKNHVSVEN